MPTHGGRRSGQRCLQWRVVPLKPYRGRHPGPRQRKERLAIFAVVSRFRPGKASVAMFPHTDLRKATASGVGVTPCSLVFSLSRDSLIPRDGANQCASFS